MPRLPLARTHRPQRFSEVLGQSAPVRALSAAAARREIASAYIFSGTRGIGKTTIARIFAKALNCERGPAADCCGECTPCREITESRCLDVLELDAATHTGIDDVRELREAALYPPARDHYRVFILDEAHQLSQSAWNGLLKILEEPPSWCVFLFCTTEPHKIPATIESRALHFSFRSPTAAQIRGHLARIAKDEAIAVEDEALDLLVQAADGSVRDGLSALDQVRTLVEGPVTLATVRDALGLVPGEAVGRFVQALGAGDSAAALGVVAELDEQGQDLRAFTADVLERVRRLALVRAAGSDAAPGGKDIADLAARFSTEQLVWLGKVLDETEARLRQGGPTRALLDLAAVRMTSMAGLPALAEIAERLGGEAAGEPPASSSGPGESRSSPRERRPAPAGPGRPSSRGAPAQGLPAASGPSGVAEPGPASGLLAQMLGAIQEIRPPLAAYLRCARSAELLPGGVLRLGVAADNVYEARLLRPSAQEALFLAVHQATGQQARRLELVPEAAPANAAAPVANRRAVFDQARRDPLVQALFDRFGAVMVGGCALGPDKPQES